MAGVTRSEVATLQRRINDLEAERTRLMEALAQCKKEPKA